MKYCPTGSNAAQQEILVQMIEISTAKIADRDRVDWAAFLTSFHFRHPQVISGLRDKTANAISEAVAKAKAEDDQLLKDVPKGEEFEWISSKLSNLHLVQFVNLISSRRLNYRLLDMHWTVFDLSSVSHRLLLGDRPFVRVESPGMPWFVAFPLAPSHLFVACDREVAQVVKNLSRSRLVRAANIATLQAAHGFVCGNAIANFVENNFSFSNTAGLLL